MNRPDPLAQTSEQTSPSGPRSARVRLLAASRVRLTRGQRVLAVLTTAAILMSGFNALLQAARLLVEWRLLGH